VVDIRSAGTLPDLPAGPGVYVVVCGYMGRTDCHLGEILYIGLSNNLRRRVAYALAAEGNSAPHAIQGPLRAFQSEGGAATLLYVPVEEEEALRGVESALLTEYLLRRGRFPRWNKAGPGRTKPDEASFALATAILESLNVRRT
jgi:hypothetical protein